ncbi:hypothetical protein HG535_0H01170 [Zygotorulaspora mrakii]|uniref:Vacuolar protein sorting-associated protein 51 homolog n=1 Tax=Zygotorulaspora mrakii TaxID=42260 RepID=A0A7H9B8M7_ZYGMR|nr:uncharacterized protein HG535_0H01170 [Zygotorulaspora mrakii]QLG74790.1 hypothetical protein HG535_0H01170 [Zygotorulaspora mrakii]
MAEQISHKKSLRVSRLGRDRRQLLKEYYKLESAQEEALAETGNGKLEHNQIENAADVSESPEKEVEKSIGDQTFKELVQTHNTLLKKETETNNSIKNTIYENYYDLIKVDTLLKGITEANEPQLSQLRKTVEMLRK